MWQQWLELIVVEVGFEMRELLGGIARFKQRRNALTNRGLQIRLLNDLVVVSGFQVAVRLRSAVGPAYCC